jgi:antibiotic biosynthesis monooxygenase (ABM) superfamily enzyme
VADAARHYPGDQGVTVVPPPAGDCECLIVFRFDSEEHLRAWQESDERRRLIERSSTLADEPPRERQVTGLETWFAVQGGQVRLPPPRRKMWLLTSVAIYPLLTLLTLVLGPVLSELPLAARFAITTPILGALMTWLAGYAAPEPPVRRLAARFTARVVSVQSMIVEQRAVLDRLAHALLQWKTLQPPYSRRAGNGAGCATGLLASARRGRHRIPPPHGGLPAAEMSIEPQEM